MRSAGKTLACALLVGIVASCEPDEPPAGALRGPPRVVEKGGVRVEIPAGALEDGVDVTIREIDTGGLPEASTVLGSAYEIGPARADFEKPLTVWLPLRTRVPNGRRAALSDLEEGAWSDLSDARFGFRSLGGEIRQPQTLAARAVEADPDVTGFSGIAVQASVLVEGDEAHAFGGWKATHDVVTVTGRKSPDGTGRFRFFGFDDRGGYEGTFAIADGRFSVDLMAPAGDSTAVLETATHVYSLALTRACDPVHSDCSDIALGNVAVVGGTKLGAGPDGSSWIVGHGTVEVTGRSSVVGHASWLLFGRPARFDTFEVEDRAGLGAFRVEIPLRSGPNFVLLENAHAGDHLLEIENEGPSGLDGESRAP